MSIHPLIHFLYPLNPTQGRRGLEIIPAVFGREMGYTMDRPPVHHRALSNVFAIIKAECKYFIEL